MVKSLENHREIPQWDYGTTANDFNPPTSSSSSGLMLKEHGIMAVAQPEVLQNYLFPISDILTEKVLMYRESVNRLMASDTESQEDFHKLLIITGPSSIKDPVQSKFCAQWISKISGKRTYKVSGQQQDKDFATEELNNNLYKLYNGGSDLDSHFGEASSSILLTMRANATANDSSMYPIQSTKEVHFGLPLYRTLLHELAQYCPITVSLSNTISPQYFSDLCCLGLVDSSFLESQLHRELVSGISYPCGFQISDCTDYKLSKGKEAMFASGFPHSFLTITKNGSVAQVETTGNQDTFLVVSIEAPIGDDEEEFDRYQNQVSSFLANIDSNTATTGHKLKVIVDVGVLELENYERTSQLVIGLIKNRATYGGLLGFMIDSGDLYLPETTQVVEINPLNYQSEDGFQFNNLKEKLMALKDRGGTKARGSGYTSFVLAHQLIQTIREANELKRLVSEQS